jgi:hypothetical protein
MIGNKVAHFEITALLGSGGMNRLSEAKAIPASWSVHRWTSKEAGVRLGQFGADNNQRPPRGRQ